MPDQYDGLITAESQPDYDSWGPDTYWDCNQWKYYHMVLVEKYGLQQANQLWLSKWNAQDFFSGPYSWCKYDQSFVDYFKTNSIDMSNPVSAVVVGAGAVISNLANAAANTSAGVNNISEVLKQLAPIALVIALLIFGVWATKKYA